MATFLTVLPRAGFRTQSKVFGGAFLQNNLLVVVLDGLFFIWETEQRSRVALDRWLSYTVTIVRKLA